MSKRWFVATLLLQCKVTEEDPGPWTVDEQILVLRASTSDEAYGKALSFSHEAEHSYANAEGDTFYWQLVGLVQIEELVGNRITDGTEIRSRLFESREPTALVPEKENLLAYWAERNKDKRAKDILEGDDS